MKTSKTQYEYALVKKASRVVQSVSTFEQVNVARKYLIQAAKQITKPQYISLLQACFGTLHRKSIGYDITRDRIEEGLKQWAQQKI